MQLTQIIKAILNVVLSIIGAFLGIRILLKLFGANAEAEFVSWIYDTSAPLLEPFENIFPTTRLEGDFILEFSTLFALVVYGLIGAIIFAGLDALEKGAAKK